MLTIFCVNVCFCILKHLLIRRTVNGRVMVASVRKNSAAEDVSINWRVFGNISFKWRPVNRRSLPRLGDWCLDSSPISLGHLQLFSVWFCPNNSARTKPQCALFAFHAALLGTLAGSVFDRTFFSLGWTICIKILAFTIFLSTPAKPLFVVNEANARKVH